MDGRAEYHIPVLLNEAVEALDVKSAGVYVDCTFGGGGHSAAILSRLGPDGRLIAFDQDADARANLPDDNRVLFLPHNFRHLQRFLRLHEVELVDGILADLGVSSHQFDESERGFSTRANDAMLDMRMDRRQEVTAQTVLATYSEQQLHKMFERYGEVTNAKTLARTIVDTRRTMPLRTIADFKNAVGGIVKGHPAKYFAQVFQSLRIEVNDEMGALRDMLEQAAVMLNERGRLAVITFHSVEDRIVKVFMKNGRFEEEADLDPFGRKSVKSPLQVLSKKPIVPSEEELRLNPRSRSAKLRVAEKRTISNEAK